MNNKAFTIMELLTVMVIMSLIMMIVFPSINKLLKNNTEKKYQTYQDMMVEYAIISEINSFPINLEDLEGLLDIKRECDGYVDMVDDEYKAYICCGEECKDYETE